MMAPKKGRPKNDDNNHNSNSIINDINIEYVSTKTDKFDNTIAYFKLTDRKSILKPIIDTQANDKDVKLPIWTTDTQDVISKVKEKWINASDDLQLLTKYMINIDVTACSLDTDSGNMKGYYIRIMKIEKKQMEDVNDDD